MHQTNHDAHDDENDEPTRPNTDVHALWTNAAKELSRKLVECARIKQRCFDVLDTKGAKELYLYSKELQALTQVMNNLDSLTPELAAKFRRLSIDRITQLHDETAELLKL